MTKSTTVLLLLAVALATAAPMCTPSQCEQAKRQVVAICKADPESQACTIAKARLIESCPEPTPSPTPTASPTPTPAPTPTPTPAPTPTPTPQPTPTPTPVPTPTPTPTPTPQPGPTNPPFVWKFTNTPPPEKCARLAGTSYLWAVDAVFGTGSNAIKPRPNESVHDFYVRMSPGLWDRGFGTAIYGEELAVQKGEGYSENFDRVLSSGEPRWGFGSYRSTCKPASYSQRISPGPAPTPEPTPAPTPTPTPSPSPTPTPQPTPTPGPGPTCTFTRADFLRSGEIAAVKDTTAEGQSRLNFDSTAKVCDEAKCATVGFPAGTRCCPNFPEGSPLVPPAFAAQCDVDMTTPRKWTITGGEFCNAGGPDGLATNPMRNCAHGGPGVIAEASGGKCNATHYPCKGDQCKADCDAGAAPAESVPAPVVVGPTVVPPPPVAPTCPAVGALAIQVEGGERMGPKHEGAHKYALTALADGKVKPRPCVAWKSWQGNITDQGMGNAVLFSTSGNYSFQACALPAGHPCASVKR